jgi:hypothetical protein
MSKTIAEAGESVPRPTRSPASSNSRTGAMPQPRSAFERGQWMTGRSSSAAVAMSCGLRKTLELVEVQGFPLRLQDVRRHRQAAPAGDRDQAFVVLAGDGEGRVR